MSLKKYRFASSTTQFTSNRAASREREGEQEASPQRERMVLRLSRLQPLFARQKGGMTLSRRHLPPCGSLGIIQHSSTGSNYGQGRTSGENAKFFSASELPRSNSKLRSSQLSSFNGDVQSVADRSIVEMLPNAEEVFYMPRKFRQCDNKTVFTLAILGKHGARRERLVREIMRVDMCDWETARGKVEIINKVNDQKAWFAKLPYRIGVLIGFSGVLSVPLVFHRESVLWCAEHIVKYPGMRSTCDLDS